MTEKLTIGDVSRMTGLPIRTIRFYEAERVIPPAERSESGYRLYTPADVRRLRLARHSRLLGISLPEVKRLIDLAFDSDCGAFLQQVLEIVAAERAQIDQRIAELQALRRDLDHLEEHVRHCACEATPGQLVADCELCPLIDEEGGERR